MKPNLSIIIPFAGEYPQVLFTIQAIAESLKGKIPFEIIAVNNDCLELRQQWLNIKNKVANQLNQEEEITFETLDKHIQSLSVMANRDPNDFDGLEKSGQAVKSSAQGNPWLKYMEFNGRLSHWECKRIACEAAEGDTFLFIDSHCIPSLGIDEMYRVYQGYRDKAVFHMPVTYKILEWRRLIYKMVIENEFYSYSFCGFPGEDHDFHQELVNVPVMSTCGLMISKEVYERVGGWPTGFGAYGGGENFMNYALAVVGMEKYIYPGVTLHHHGERRDYHSDYTTTLWNKLVAHYLFGGGYRLKALAENSKGRPEVIEKMVQDIIMIPEYTRHREIIRKNTTVHLQTWVKKWEEKNAD